MNDLLSPIERAVLVHCAQPKAYQQILIELGEIFETRSLFSAVGFLRRRKLLVNLEGNSLHPPVYHRSELAEQVLAHDTRLGDRRQVIVHELTRPSRRLYVVPR